MLQNKKPLKNQGFFKLITGIEPVTSALPMRRTTDCAISANMRKLCHSRSLLYQSLPTLSINSIHQKSSNL